MSKLKAWYANLSPARKVVGCTLLVVGTMIALTPSADTSKNSVSTSLSASQESSISSRESEKIVTEKKTVTEKMRVAFRKTTRSDSTLEEGKRRREVTGIKGTMTYTYEVTFVDGKQTKKKLLKKAMTTAPINEVVAIGTKKASNCDPNYAGACVPIAYDVDCSGGSGNGPVYVSGPLRLIGVDIYDLDRDGNGIGCE